MMHSGQNCLSRHMGLPCHQEHLIICGQSPGTSTSLAGDEPTRRLCVMWFLSTSSVLPQMEVSLEDSPYHEDCPLTGTHQRIQFWILNGSWADKSKRPILPPEIQARR